MGTGTDKATGGMRGTTHYNMRVLNSCCCCCWWHRWQWQWLVDPRENKAKLSSGANPSSATESNKFLSFQRIWSFCGDIVAPKHNPMPKP